VNLVLALLYLNAYRKRVELALSPFELYVTRLSIADNLATMAVGLVSAGLAQVVPSPHASAIAGYVYFAVAIPKFVTGWLRGRRSRRGNA
jgi:hypothetical protein